MNTREIVVVVARWRALFCALGAVLLTFGWAVSAQAVEVPALFTAEVPYDASADDGVDTAYAAALMEVLARVSSSELSSDAGAVEALFPSPATLVTQFRPGSDGTLWVSFDGEAIEQVLRDSGETLWGGDRPLTIVWLAVDWGAGQREIVGADDLSGSRAQSRSIDRNRRLRERVLEIAQQRGLPLVFPLLDTTDLQSVTFSDIWGGFEERVVAASGRYDVNSILIGRVRASSQQRNRWSYRLGGERREWTGSPEEVVAQIADMMALEFSVGGNAPMGSFVLNVSGIESVDGYGSVQQLLRGVPMIEAVRIVEVAGDTISYQVEVRGGESRLRRALHLAGLIEAGDDGGFGNAAPASAALEFFYSP